MKNKITLSALILATLMLGGCATPGDTGLVTGGVIGGIAGSALTGGSTIGTVAGTVGGALVGQDVARRNAYCH